MGVRIARTLADDTSATPGNKIATGFHDEPGVESRGKSLSRHCLTEAINHSGVIRKVLAGEVGQTEQQFSKSLSGIPGGDFNAVLDNVRSSIRLKYAQLLAEVEREGGLEEIAAEDLAHAAIRYLRTRRLPTKTTRVAKAGLR